MTRSSGEHAGISMTGETKRKLTHLLVLILPVGIIVTSESTMLLVLIPSTLAALAADWLRARSAPFSRIVSLVFGSMLRKHEVPEIGKPPVVNGATWTLLSMTVLLTIFPAPIAVVAYSLAMVGDASAAMVGRTIGKHPWGRPGCTIEGSLAYALTAFATAAILGGGDLSAFSPYSLPIFPLLLSSLIAAGVEVSPIPGNDNINAPVIVAFFLLFVLNATYDFSFSFFPLFS